MDGAIATKRNARNLDKRENSTWVYVVAEEIICALLWKTLQSVSADAGATPTRSVPRSTQRDSQDRAGTVPCLQSRRHLRLYAAFFKIASRSKLGFVGSVMTVTLSAFHPVDSTS